MDAIENEMKGATDAQLRTWLEGVSRAELDDVEFMGLRGNRLTGDGFRSLFAASSYPKLECVELGDNQLGAGGGVSWIREIRGITHGPSEFHAPFNGLADKDVAALVASGWLNGVAHLSLWGNPIGDAGLHALAASELRPSGLFLHWTAGSDEGLAALMASDFVSQVRHLDIRGTAAGPLTAAAVASSGPLTHNLSVLKARSSRMTSPQITAIKATMADDSTWVQSVAPLEAGHRYHCFRCMSPNDERQPRCTMCLDDMTTDAGYELTAEGFAAEPDARCDACGGGKKATAACPWCRRNTLLSILPPHLCPTR